MLRLLLHSKLVTCLGRLPNSCSVMARISLDSSVIQKMSEWYLRWTELKNADCAVFWNKILKTVDITVTVKPSQRLAEVTARSSGSSDYPSSGHWPIAMNKLGAVSKSTASSLFQLDSNVGEHQACHLSLQPFWYYIPHPLCRIYAYEQYTETRLLSVWNIADYSHSWFQKGSVLLSRKFEWSYMIFMWSLVRNTRLASPNVCSTF